MISSSSNFWDAFDPSFVVAMRMNFQKDEVYHGDTSRLAGALALSQHSTCWEPKCVCCVNVCFVTYHVVWLGGK